jgi:hypothetical protein
MDEALYTLIFGMDCCMIDTWEYEVILRRMRSVSSCSKCSEIILGSLNDLYSMRFSIRINSGSRSRLVLLERLATSAKLNLTLLRLELLAYQMHRLHVREPLHRFLLLRTGVKPNAVLQGLRCMFRLSALRCPARLTRCGQISRRGEVAATSNRYAI